MRDHDRFHAYSSCLSPGKGVHVERQRTGGAARPRSACTGGRIIGATAEGHQPCPPVPSAHARARSPQRGRSRGDATSDKPVVHDAARKSPWCLLLSPAAAAPAAPAGCRCGSSRACLRFLPPHRWRRLSLVLHTRFPRHPCGAVLRCHGEKHAWLCVPACHRVVHLVHRPLAR